MSSSPEEEKRPVESTCSAVSSLENIQCFMVTFREHWALSSMSRLYWQNYTISIRPVEIKVPLTLHMELGLESHATSHSRNEELWEVLGGTVLLP